MWRRVMDRAIKTGSVDERFTFHDLRALAAGKADDWQLLGHSDRRTFERVYYRKEKRVKPTQ